MKALLLIFAAAAGLLSTQSYASTIQANCFEGAAANASEQRKIKSLALQAFPQGQSNVDIRLEDSPKTYSITFKSGTEAMLFLNQLKNQDSNELQFSLGSGLADISHGKSDLNHCIFENGYSVTAK